MATFLSRNPVEDSKCTTAVAQQEHWSSWSHLRPTSSQSLGAGCRGTHRSHRVSRFHCTAQMDLATQSPRLFAWTFSEQKLAQLPVPCAFRSLAGCSALVWGVRCRSARLGFHRLWEAFVARGSMAVSLHRLPLSTAPLLSMCCLLGASNRLAGRGKPCLGKSYCVWYSQGLAALKTREISRMLYQYTGSCYHVRSR